ncbi:MAG TPA: ferritin-like domain-containing protein [Kofleriaceae bacterium]|jgi:bacterioferritin
MNEFKSDIEAIRKRAREKMDQGPITEAYKADVKRVISVLNEVLATEIVCTLRYKNHYYTAKGINSDAVKQEFLEHAKDEESHADMVAERINELGGDPDYNPATLTKRSHSQYEVAESLEDMLREDLIAERIAVETYSEIARWLGTNDITTRRVIENILAKEEEHANDMHDLLERVGAKK